MQVLLQQIKAGIWRAFIGGLLGYSILIIVDLFFFEIFATNKYAIIDAVIAFAIFFLVFPSVKQIISK